MVGYSHYRNPRIGLELGVSGNTRDGTVIYLGNQTNGQRVKNSLTDIVNNHILWYKEKRTLQVVL